MVGFVDFNFSTQKKTTYLRCNLRVMKYIRLLAIFFLVCSTSIAQEKFTISGTLKSSEDGGDLIGAQILINELPGTGGVTNVFGFYSITVPQGEYTVTYRSVGFKEQAIKLKLNIDTVVNLEMNPSSELLNAVEVSAEKLDENIKSTEMGVEKLSIKDIETIPVLFGEKDVMKTMQLMPGVKSAGEGNSGFFVRGGAADQNLILLDDAPVYNASHLLGFFSVFNSDALKDVKLYKGAAPAQFGGRLSSVMDIRMKEGNTKGLSVSGGLGLISSKLTVEAPIVKDKGAFIISGRRTYADLFLGFSNDDLIKNSTLYFYDLNAKANYKFGEKDRVFVSGYFGRDVLGFDDQFGFDWGNTTGTVRWNHIYNDKLFGNTSLIYSNYDYKIEAGIGENTFEVSSIIQDFNLKEDFSYYLNANHTLKFGGNIIHHTIKPGEFQSSGGDINTDNIDNRYSLESALYISNDHKISNRLALTYGLRYSNFMQLGPGEVLTYDVFGNVTNSQTFNEWETVTSYNGWSPRLSANFQLTETSALKASYSRTYQYLHLLSNSTSSTPTDIWLPSSNNIKPQRADQYSLGYFKNFKKNTYEFSAETYYKDMDNVIDYRDGAQVTFNPTVEGELLYGIGRAYGVEFLLKKKRGQFTGWVSYTLSKTEKKIDQINNGEWFNAKQDRTHDISIVGMYNINPRLNVSATWVYYTGNAVTFPSGKYYIEGEQVDLYSERNAYRMPDYHRLDLGLTLKNKNVKTIKDVDTGKSLTVPRRFESSWNFSVYNLYGRENAYSISFEQNEITGQTEAIQTALFKTIPSISYQFKF